MLDLALIENTIQELENSDTTFNNCEKLASLYIVREHLQDANLTVVNKSEKEIIDELNDILPSYSMYCKKKREYQMNKLGADVVLQSLQEICREILEFIHTLYSGTDMPEERHIIVETLSNIQF